MVRNSYAAATSTYTIYHYPGGSATPLVYFKDFGGGTRFLNLPGTDTRIASDGGTIKMNNVTQFVSSLVMSGGASIRAGGIKTANASLSVGSVDNTSTYTSTIALSGANTSDVVMLGIPDSCVSSIVGAHSFYAWVSTSGVIGIRVSNFSGGALNFGSGSFRVFVMQSV